MSCNDGVGLPPSPGKGLPESHASIPLDQSQFLPLCAQGLGVQGCHHRRCRVRTTVTITPRKRTKGSQVFTNPPMLQEGRGETFKCEKSAETEGWENNWRNQRETDAFLPVTYCWHCHTSHPGDSVLKTETRSGPQ